MSDEIKSHLTNTDTWKRLLYMILFVVIFYVMEIIIALVVLFQVILTLFTGSQNKRVLDFGAQLGGYLYEIVQYLTYNSDKAPFPFAEWPKKGAVAKGVKSSSAQKVAAKKSLSGKEEKGEA